MLPRPYATQNPLWPQCQLPVLRTRQMSNAVVMLIILCRTGKLDRRGEEGRGGSVLAHTLETMPNFTQVQIICTSVTGNSDTSALPDGVFFKAKVLYGHVLYLL